jgi:hypothetical protein
MRFNLIGLVMFLAAIGAALGISHLLGSSSDRFAMILTGPLLSIVDIALRKARGASLFRGAGGGTILFVPMWIWGVLFTVAAATTTHVGSH